jgi:N6-adenosine-specific RNA methylase IME4/ParB-like chromosome segregation protein Spo0J
VSIAATHRQVLVAAINVMERLRPLRDAVVSELAGSMSQIGLINPIAITYPNGRASPLLVAGANRLEAARRLKWESIDCTIIEASDVNTTKLAEIDENLIRADLTPAERVIHIAERKRIYEELHPETKNGATGKYRPKVQLSQDGTPEVPAFIEDAAKKTGKGRTTIAREATRAKHIPRIADCIGTSLDQGEELDALAKLKEEQQSELITRAANGEKVSAKPEAKRAARAIRTATFAEITKQAMENLGTKTYGVIYADPPWRFEPYSRDSGMDRAADNHYETIALEDIKAMAVPAADDCVLFMWATAPMLPEALEVMTAWGFTYKSHCIWLKDRIGTGYWFRNEHELLLIGTRGSVPAPAPGQQYASVIEAPVTKHSAKPPHFAEMIEEMFPNVPAVELFARGQRLGWDVWGNEAA